MKIGLIDMDNISKKRVSFGLLRTFGNASALSP